MWLTKNWMACAWWENATTQGGQFLPFCKSLTALFLKLRHMELKNLAAPFYSVILQISTNSSFRTVHCRGLKWIQLILKRTESLPLVLFLYNLAGLGPRRVMGSPQVKLKNEATFCKFFAIEKTKESWFATWHWRKSWLRWPGLIQMFLTKEIIQQYL